MIIMFDVDGVLAHFTEGFTRVCRKISGGLTAIHGQMDQKKWDDETIPADIQDRAWEHIKQSKSFWFGLPPLASEDEFRRIDALDAKNDVYFVTSRVGQDPRAQTRDWLRHQGIENPTVIVSSRKGDAALALKADYAIDDKAGNVLVVYYQSPKTKTYVYDAPYNQFDHEVVGGKVRRVKTVTEFLDDVEAKR